MRSRVVSLFLIVFAFTLITFTGCQRVRNVVDTEQPEMIRVQVDSIAYGKDGYVATVTQVETGDLYEMLVSIPNLGDRYVSLEVGDVASVTFDSVLEKDPPIIYPITIIVESGTP